MGKRGITVQFLDLFQKGAFTDKIKKVTFENTKYRHKGSIILVHRKKKNN